jgi:hypothetical protein
LLGEAEGDPQLGAVELARDQRKLEVPRHDADDDVGLAVEQDFAVEDLRVAVEAGLPRGITHDGYLLVMLVFLRGEDPAQLRLNAQGREDSCGKARGVYLSGISGTGKLICREPVAPKGGEGFGLARVGDDVRNGNGSPAIAAQIRSFDMVREHHQTARIRKWQWAQQNAFNDGENGCGGSNPECEHQHRCDREAR